MNPATRRLAATGLLIEFIFCQLRHPPHRGRRHCVLLQLRRARRRQRDLQLRLALRPRLHLLLRELAARLAPHLRRLGRPWTGRGPSLRVLEGA